MARMDTRDTRRDVKERYPDHGMTFIRSMLPPEEITTFSFVRRIAFQLWKRDAPGVVAVHSKALEGGFARKRPASGADLELAVEVTPGNWVDLLLQAKRLYEPHPGKNGAYEGWKMDQIKKLRRWAARNGDRTPGMLLYNAEIPPFVATRHDVALGGCDMSPIRCHGYRRPVWDPPDRRSPTGITLLVLPRLPSRLPRVLSVDSLPADLANQYASPLECIFCPGRLATATSTREEITKRPAVAIEPKSQAPEWAAMLLAAVEGQADSEGARPTSRVGLSPDDNRWNAQCSVVLPYVE